MAYLKVGDVIPMEMGGQCKVLDAKGRKGHYFGEGGQGVVYKVEFMGKEYALKWYFTNAIHDKEAFRQNLQENIDAGPPSDKFVWPRFMTGYKDGSFGYLMDIFPRDYTPFTDIMIKPEKAKFLGMKNKEGRVVISSLEAMLNAALNIINAFRELHSKGKSYQDLNDGGFYVRLGDGDVLICDCDNVAPYGKNLGIAGKPGYMAPEIVSGEGKVAPSANTDLYSLANVLFRLLMRGDPMAGAKDAVLCLTEKFEKELYGTSAIFVYDPDNDKNRPVRGVHNNVIRQWPTYPQFMRDAFIKSFTEGVRDPNKRLSDNDWQKLFVRLKGELIQCAGCGTRGFAGIFKKEGDSLVCPAPACKHAHPMPQEVSPNGFPVLLFPGVKLLHAHTDSTGRYLDSEGYLTHTGIIIRNPNDPSRWGIRNVSKAAWSLKEPGKDGRRELEPGKPVAITSGLEISFPNGESVTIQ